MTALPPPTPRTPPVGSRGKANFWHRRGRWGKIGVVGGGVMAGLLVVGVLIPAEETRGADATAERAAETTQPTRVTTSTATTSTTVQRDATTVTSRAPATSAPTTEIPESTATRVETPPPPTLPPTPVPTSAAPVVTTPTQPIVSRVIDGDTVAMSDGTTIRLIGIDTPEQGECGYDEAADTLGMILFGQNVTLIPGARDDSDRYGRLLRYIDLADGRDVNLAMIGSGQAIARYDSRDGYGRHTREDAYVAADATSPAFCSTPVPPPAPLPFIATPANVHYENCTAVRAAGAAPIRAGDPGFQSKFDRDNDGVGCE